MLLPRLAALVAVALVAAALVGCMKPAASSGPAPLVIAVSRVSAPQVAVGGPVDAAPHSTFASDGYAPGDHVSVMSNGAWLEGTLLERRGDRWLVHYDVAWGGARDSMEELVETARLRAGGPHVDEEHSPDDVDP